MKRKIIFALIFQISICTLFSQNKTGKWYETKLENSNFKITIEENNDIYSGTFNWEWDNWINNVNVPIDEVLFKKDSLLFEITNGGYALNFKLKRDVETETYDGFIFINSKQLQAVSFGRNFTEIDIKDISKAKKKYTRQDTLRGTITPERIWWNLTHYKLDFELDIENRFIKGSNTITYTVLASKNVMQIDLQSPMKITKVNQSGKSLTFKQDGNAYFIQLNENQIIGTSKEIEVFYEGNPKEAPRPPWDGGFTWRKDANGKPLVFTSCQGEGASLWWPNKDHMYDEPDNGIIIRVNVPKDLTAVSNGKLTATEKKKNGTTTYEWTVVNPINNYGVSLNVAAYVHYSDPYKGLKGTLECNYYVLSENLEKAKVQFKQVHLMLEAFEHWFGAYPFYEDGYKLVEGVGMEHQSAVGYWGYQNGMPADGKDSSGTGWGLKFDFLIIHESGHEWFANNITYKDMADMWVHEGFTNYAEALYLEYHFGKTAGEEYIKGLSKLILNDKPIIGNYDINDLNYTRDVYKKSAVILHTLRNALNDDIKWRTILTGLNTEFYHKTVTSADIENYIIKHSGLNLKPFFDQYLRTTKRPILEYYFKDNQFVYRWINTIVGFQMPLKVYVDNKEYWITPKTKWTSYYLNDSDSKRELIIDPNFYVLSLKNLK
ncbi:MULTISPECIES: M1 family metallopeptidase [unclassified Polaribacter]|uniref:M1 family metallopeptidase n=1 Tax=unclassified Polaribacter TaxID=196858 RepID=UPI0011BE380A|nr:MULTISPECIES: M1 family metallopeptidase [unclassified Polaribacter]TXD53072.1 M1 family metallopeptidase [Polaribacter sp. IC063]TXD59021.1 M1 family metallopeptidase [Polaribacter sp. IC066]